MKKIYGMMLVLLLLVVAIPAMAWEAKEEFHQTYTFNQGGRIQLDNVNGDVQILSWDKNEVKVDAIKQAHSQNGLDEAKIVVEADSNSIRIETKYPQHDNWRGNNNPATVDYTLTVPRDVILDEIELVNGDLDITGVRGDVTASCVNGRLLANGLAGEADLSTVNGRLEAVFEQTKDVKRIKLDSVNGSITLTMPANADANVNAETVSGNISNDFGLEENDGEYVGHDLSGKLGNGSTRISLSNVNGSIRIKKI